MLTKLYEIIFSYIFFIQNFRVLQDIKVNIKIFKPIASLTIAPKMIVDTS
jgi:hypothetical protein